MTEMDVVTDGEEVHALDEMQVLFEALEEAESENDLKDLSEVRKDECEYILNYFEPRRTLFKF